MANFKALPIAAAVVASLAAMSASAVEFHGYMRAGIGQNADGGGQVCYGNGGGAAHYVGRLGDECDMYAELTLGQEVYNRDGKTFGVVSTIAYGTWESLGSVQGDSRGNSWQADAGGAGPWNGGRLSVREMYATGKGLVGDSTLWMGKRFGQRKDIHIMDLFYLMNSGYGAGIDSLSAGPGKFSFQWVQTATEQDPALAGVDTSGAPYLRSNKLDARYSLPVFGDHNIEVVGIYGKPTLTDAQKATASDEFKDGGYLAMIEHTMPLLGGFNKVAFQYATNSLVDGLMTNFGGLNYAPWWVGANGSTGYRFLDHGVVKFGKSVELGYALTYSKSDIDDADAGDAWRDFERMNVVVRPMYKWNDVVSTALELGYVEQQGNDAGQEKTDLSKVTLAQQWSPLQNGGFWARPQFRLFVSQYGGDNAEDADTMFGAQVEAWW